MINRLREETQAADEAQALPVSRSSNIPMLDPTSVPNDLEQIYRLLGNETILIPCCRKEKIPLRAQWNKTKLEETHHPDYIRALEWNNVAAMLGESSGNLIDIDFDKEGFMRQFEELNEDLFARTLRTCGSRGGHCFFRMKGDYPRKVQFIKDADKNPVGEFRGGNCKSIFAGTHKDGCEYQILNPVPPLEIEFSDLQWPPGYDYPWMISEDQEIAMRVGPAYALTAKGGIGSINAAFFAEWTKHKLELIYEESEGCFYLYDPATGLWERVQDGPMAEKVWIVCNEWIDTQDAAVAESLKGKFTQRIRMDIIAMLKSKAPVNGFFNEGPYYGQRDKLFHTREGMMQCLPTGGAGNVCYLHRPFAPEFRSRHQFDCCYLDDPQCPRFDGLMVSMVGEENVPFALKMLGYLLIDGNPGQLINMFKGPARSGKSQLVKILQEILPKRSWGQLRTNQLDGRFETGAYADKRLVFGPDVNKDYLRVEGASYLKALTGGDNMDAELKGVNGRIQFTGDKHVLITTNDVLRLAAGEDVGAWKRRLVVIETRAADPDNLVADLAGEIKTEKDAVFTKLMNAGYQAAVELAEKGRIEVPEQFQLGTCNGIILIGDISQWMEESVSEGTDAFTTADLFIHYQRWCAGRGETAETTSKFEKALKRQMEERNHPSSGSIRGPNGTQKMGYRNLEVKS